MSAQSPQSKARYVPDSKVTANPPSDARIAFIPADGDEGDEDYTTVADLGTGGGGQTLVIANDEDVTVAASPGTTIVLYSALTTTRQVSLPAAASVPMTVIVADLNGNTTPGVQVQTVAHGTDTIPNNDALTAPNESLTRVNDGVSQWLNLDLPASIDGLLTNLRLKTEAAGSVAAPSGGSVVDVQARAAIAAIIAALAPPG